MPENVWDMLAKAGRNAIGSATDTLTGSLTAQVADFKQMPTRYNVMAARVVRLRNSAKGMTNAGTAQAIAAAGDRLDRQREHFAVVNASLDAVINEWQRSGAGGIDGTAAATAANGASTLYADFASLGADVTAIEAATLTASESAIPPTGVGFVLSPVMWLAIAGVVGYFALYHGRGRE